MAEPAHMPDEQNIPDKLYFRIGEVSKLTGIKPYVLRFWESEFPGLGPRKSGTGHRLYRRKDVELVLEIKHLLYERRFTIEGARKWLETMPKGEALQSSPAPPAEPEPPAVEPPPPASSLQRELFPSIPFAQFDEIRAELQAILEMLK